LLTAEGSPTDGQWLRLPAELDGPPSLPPPDPANRQLPFGPSKQTPKVLELVGPFRARRASRFFVTLKLAPAARTSDPANSFNLGDGHAALMVDTKHTVSDSGRIGERRPTFLV